MVMRNRHEGTNTPEWWDDLPPAVRRRFSPQSRQVEAEAEGTFDEPRLEPGVHRSGHLRNLTLLAVMFLAVALAILLFLLIALTFLADVQQAVR
jgi:hypothetical protein